MTAETEGRVYNVGGQDWDEVVTAATESPEERLIVNMGPQHPSTHGVLRLILTLDGETVTELRPVIGYLHTGIEKNMEFRTWTQGVTFCTRMDYLSPIFNETVYCMAVERLLGIEQEIPPRATVLRVLMMELNRISSHMMAIGTFGLELGATTVLLYGLREREKVLDLFELITGLRMNHAYVRPGGVSQDLPHGALEGLREFLRVMPRQIGELRALLDANPIYLARTVENHLCSSVRLLLRYSESGLSVEPFKTSCLNRRQVEGGELDLLHARPRSCADRSHSLILTRAHRKS